MAYLSRILAVELACLFKIFLGLLEAEQGDCRIVSCLLRQYDYVKGVLEGLHVQEERFVSLLSLKRIAPCASEVMDHSISLVVDKQSPQVFDQGLREESFALFDVVLFENFKARKPDFFEIYLQLLAELASVSALLGDCGEDNEHDHAERASIHEDAWEVEQVHELPNLLLHAVSCPVVTSFGEALSIQKFAIKVAELPQQRLVQGILFYTTTKLVHVKIIRGWVAFAFGLKREGARQVL